MLYALAVTLFAIVCLFLIVVVLIQPGQLGRGGSALGASAGGSSGRGASVVFKRVTAGAAAMFMILSILLSLHTSDRSAVDDVAPVTPPAAPTEAKPETGDKGAAPAEPAAKPAEAAPAAAPAAPAAAPAAPAAAPSPAAP